MSNFTPAAAVAPVFSCYADDPDFVELLGLFAERIEPIRSELESALAAGDQKALTTYAHRLNGSAGSYGFAPLSDAAARLERAATEDNSAAVQCAWEDVGSELLRVEAGFAASRGRTQPPGP